LHYESPPRKGRQPLSPKREKQLKIRNITVYNRKTVTFGHVNGIRPKQGDCITASAPHNETNQMSQTLSQLKPTLDPKTLTTYSV
jgi:hypothetical protein